MYTNRGFNITPYNGDNGFEMLRDHLGGANLNIVGRECLMKYLNQPIHASRWEEYVLN